MPHLKFKHWLVAAIPVAIALTALAWQTKNPSKNNTKEPVADTVPSKNHHKVIRDWDNNSDAKDIDDEIRKLDEAMKNVDGKFENIDWGSIQKEVNDAMKNVNITLEHQQIDMEKMQKDIDKAMKDIDFEKIQKETREAMQQVEENIDFKKMQADIEKSLAKEKEYLNSDAFKESIEAASKVNMDKVRENVNAAMRELKENKFNLEETMVNAKEEIKKAKEELEGYREMLNAMQKDGLINTKEDYNIEFDNGGLYINHQKQSQAITDKYKGYFKKDGTRIYKKSGRFNINID
ncbi:MAG: hypothetical protein JST87_14885 [Bacteroidetes bacterium]|nr:hypothetical protein [Bacteroidota bacterium]